MADGEGAPAHVVGSDPKKRKMMAIGIGIAGLFVVMLMYGKGKKGSQASGPTQYGPPGGVTADVAVPSGDVSPSDLMAQFATTEQATQAQYNSSYQNQIAALNDEISKLANQQPPIVNVNVPPDNNPPPDQPPPDDNPPPDNPPPPDPPPPPPPPPPTTVTVLPWDAWTGDAINGHPWQSTLWGIGQHYHEDWPTIWAANPQIQNPNLIHPGDVITVPNR